MYYVERQSLVKTGQPMYFDRLYSLPYGPIVSAVNDGINSAAYNFNLSPWEDHFSLDCNAVELKMEADYSQLSPFEEQLIKDTFEKFAGWEFRSIRAFFDALPEHKETSTRENIDHAVILQAEGYEDEEITEALSEINYLHFLENILNIA